MKYGLLSGTKGDLQKLKTILKELKEVEEVDRIICLGNVERDFNGISCFKELQKSLKRNNPETFLIGTYGDRALLEVMKDQKRALDLKSRIPSLYLEGEDFTFAFDNTGLSIGDLHITMPRYRITEADNQEVSIGKLLSSMRAFEDEKLKMLFTGNYPRNLAYSLDQKGNMKCLSDLIELDEGIIGIDEDKKYFVNIGPFSKSRYLLFDEKSLISKI